MTAEQFYMKHEAPGGRFTGETRKQVFTFAEAYAAHVREAAQVEIEQLKCEVADAHLNCPADDLEAQLEVARIFKEDNIKLYGECEAAERKLAELDKALQSALFPLAVLVQSGECVAAATALNEELKLQIITAHDDVYAALASLRAESKEG